jgi:tetratricopeptide (TPR) repeat protein
MTLVPPPVDEVQVCPNCSTLNHPNAVVCIGCGVRLDTYQEVRQEFQNRQNEKTEDHLAQLRSSASERVEQEVNRGRSAFIRQLGVVAGLLVLLALLVWGIFTLLRYRENLQRQQLDSLYQRGKICEQNEDLVCARSIYQQVLDQDPQNSAASDRLLAVHTALARKYLTTGSIQLAIEELDGALALRPNDPNLLTQVFNARLQLANDLAASRRWREAIVELDKALLVRPGSLAALDEMKKIYANWYQENRRSGDWIGAWSVDRERRSRFP